MNVSFIPDTGDAPAFLSGGGEMGQRLRAFDWSRNSLGTAETWPQSLRAALSICLNSSFPIAIYWGKDLALLYNDDWSPILGDKHPWALGRPAREVWSEIWDIIGPLFEQVISTGEATRQRDQLLPMYRYGFTEECYFDYTFSPVRGETGHVEGIFNAVIETTSRVIGERRQRTLRELAAWNISEVKSVRAVCQLAAQILSENPHDLPFTLLYLLDEDERHAVCAGTSGLTAEIAVSPLTYDLSDPGGPWPFRRVMESGKAIEVSDLIEKLGPLQVGIWPEAPQRAIVLPLTRAGQNCYSGFIVAGISPRLPFNDDYQGFLDLLVGHVTAAIASARVYAEERRRSEALAALNQAKTAFFSNVSHEFRTPLTLMLSPLDHLLTQTHCELAPFVTSELELINRNAMRLLRLVNTLLDFSRIEANRVQATFCPTDVAAYTMDLTGEFRAAIEHAELRLNVDCPAISEPAYLDREMWEKIVLNLLSNAFKFTFAGEITVVLRQRERTFELRIQDTGTGIPADEMPRLFERFHRVKNAQGRTHEGSGIGLALVQELVKIHGGSIAAESVFGKGTTFIVNIPLGFAHLPADQILDTQLDHQNRSGAVAYVEEALRWLPADQSVVNASPHNVPILQEIPESPTDPNTVRRAPSPPRVLIVDDNSDMRDYLARLLSNGHQVSAVSNGEEALIASKDVLPDLIVTDVMMPRLDGFGLLRELRADPRTQNIPVIILSARAGEESRVEGLEAGADDYLVKPFSARELLASVAARLQMATLRRETSESLRQSQERLQMALSAARMVAWQFDPTTGSLDVSDNAVEIFGLPPGFQLQHSDQAFALVHPEDLEQYRREIQQAAETCSRYQCQFRLIRQDTGVIQWMEDRGHAVSESEAGPVKLIGVVMDVTELKRAEDSLREVDRRKDEFLATLAHELRNPLAPIRNGLQLMRLVDHPNEMVTQARLMMERQLTQLVRLVDDLMDVSRISRGKLELKTAPLSLATIINSAIETSHPLLAELGHQLHVTLPPQEILLNADLTRLAQVFTNLLNNAAKYSDRGSHIFLTAQQQGSEVVVTVKDNGIGIAADQMSGIFEMFSQVDRSLEKSRGGLGIGLTLVKRLVEMHGGTIAAFSAGKGKGSEFMVRLPVIVESRSANISTSTDEIKTPRSTLRVLVVDDNRDSAISLALMLKLMGNITRTAFDGEEAVAVTEEFQPHVILLDIGLPKLNGYEVCRRIRLKPGKTAPLIIAQTGWGQREDRQKTQEAGFNHHLVKPVDPTALMKLLTDIQQQ